MVRLQSVTDISRTMESKDTSGGKHGKKGHVDPSTQKPILDGVCFFAISLTREALQMKISQVSNYVFTNLVTERK